MYIMDMATTYRHNKLITYLEKLIVEQYEDLWLSDQLVLRSEEGGLCYMGKYGAKCATLVDLSEFNPNSLNELPYVQPDLFIFYKNQYLCDNKGIKYAGFPDLVVEVWSDGNPKDEILWKKHLYSTGKNTEHWYIIQDSNTVECWYGKERLNDKSLEEILVTINGLSFDLRKLAL